MNLSIAMAGLLWVGAMQADEPVKQWSLEECIRYAIEHNIDLKQRELEQDNREVELHTSKYSWLPNLNANFGQNFDFPTPSVQRKVRGFPSHAQGF